MAWIEISVSVARDDAPLAELALEQHGALSVTLEDDEDHPVLEPDPGTIPLWPAVKVRGLFTPGTDRRPIIEALGTVTGISKPGQIHWRAFEDQDWERAWLDRFAPMKFGEKLWVVPGGMEIPFDPDHIEIHLDPGLAFGTGTHPTTALCLEWIDGQMLTACRVVDYGCGSGVLGIAAALKGAERVICVDNDPQALEATAANAERNGVSAIVECHSPETCPRVTSELVIANILAGPLIGLAPTLLGFLRAGGSLVLSGILSDQADTVVSAYQPGLGEVCVLSREEWILVAGRKKAAVDPGAPE